MLQTSAVGVHSIYVIHCKHTLENTFIDGERSIIHLHMQLLPQ